MIALLAVALLRTITPSASDAGLGIDSECAERHVEALAPASQRETLCRSLGLLSTLRRHCGHRVSLPYDIVEISTQQWMAKP
jgi:hypothetical protein